MKQITVYSLAVPVSMMFTCEWGEMTSTPVGSPCGASAKTAGGVLLLLSRAACTWATVAPALTGGISASCRSVEVLSILTQPGFRVAAEMAKRGVSICGMVMLMVSLLAGSTAPVSEPVTVNGATFHGH